MRSDHGPDPRCNICHAPFTTRLVYGAPAFVRTCQHTDADRDAAAAAAGDWTPTTTNPEVTR